MTKSTAPMPRREQLEVRRQVVAAGFLAGLDHADAARVRQPLRLQRADRRPARRRPRSRRRRRRGRRACRRRSFGDPRPEVLAPADHLRLLVEMAVEQHRAARAGVPVAGTSKNSTGVRPGKRTISQRKPVARAARAPSAPPVRITRSMCPFASHCGSKCGDFAGMRMYSVISGRSRRPSARRCAARASAVSVIVVVLGVQASRRPVSAKRSRKCSTMAAASSPA